MLLVGTKNFQERTKLKCDTPSHASRVSLNWILGPIIPKKTSRNRAQLISKTSSSKFSWKIFAGLEKTAFQTPLSNA